MRNLLILSTGVLIIILCSFGFQQNHIKKIGTNLYSITKESSKQISAEDKATLQKLINRQYTIKNLKRNVTIEKNNPVNKKGGCIVQGLYQVIIFDNRTVVIRGDKNIELDAVAKQVDAIMVKYSK